MRKSTDRLAGHDGHKCPRLLRRDVLRLGSLTGLLLTLPELLRSRAQARAAGDSTFGRARQVIVLFLHGGHPQQETFDPKPTGHSDTRGELGAIATSLPGIQFSEVLPHCARIADRLTVIRSMSHSNANHVQACLPANTGHKHPATEERRGDFPPSATDFPPFGAVLDALRPAQALPTWVRIGPLMRRNNGTVLHGQSPGFLGNRNSSFVIDEDLRRDHVTLEAIQRAPALTAIRLAGRRDLLSEFDRARRILDESVDTQNLHTFYDRAFGLLGSERTRQAFELAEELPETRSRYGLTEFGQRCLLARRLAEAGVPMINVSYCHTPQGSWDTHGDNFRQMRDSLGPTLDAAFPALVEDLDQRGLLEDTLVVAMAEFGRTPAINTSAGRDHWPWVYSIALAGAGVQRGTVFGASDPSAAYPTTEPVDPADFAATLYHLLGVSPDTVLHDALGRPHPLVIGKVIDGILA